MTTYELPPEPPVGSKVHPSKHPDVVWYRSGHDGGWSTPGRTWYSWAQLLGEYEGQGLTLIEPDQWPTDHPLIVASVDGGGPQLLSVLTTHSAATMTSAIVRRSESTLTNIVPVTVVPAAEWEALRACVKPLGYSGHTIGTSGSLIYAATRLLSATDALGLD